MRQQIATETRRIEAIRKVCAGKYPDIEAKAIEEGWDETRTELHVLRASRPKIPPSTAGSRPEPTSPQVFEAVAMMASGLPNSRVGRPSRRPTPTSTRWASSSAATSISVSANRITVVP